MMDRVKNIALHTCTIFTLAMLFCGIAGLIFTGPEPGILMTFAFLGLAIVFALLQALWFTDALIRKMSYPARTIGFGLCAFIPLSAIACAFDWFPMDNPLAWVSFAITYLVILIIIAICYGVHFKRLSGSYDEALKNYHERQEKR